MRCPICDKTVDPNQSKSLPFCSERCRLADLQHWFQEDYGMPHEPAEEDEQPPWEQGPDE